MKKWSLLCSVLLTGLFSQNTLANEFAGVRIGLGTSYFYADSYSPITGFVDEQLEGSAFKVDLGYAFSLDDSKYVKVRNKSGASTKAVLKPYLKLGAVSYEMKSKYSGSSKTFSDDSAFVGLGGRLDIGYLYIDLSADYFSQDLPEFYLNNSDAKVDAVQLAWIVGLKF